MQFLNWFTWLQLKNPCLSFQWFCAWTGSIRCFKRLTTKTVDVHHFKQHDFSAIFKRAFSDIPESIWLCLIVLLVWKMHNEDMILNAFWIVVICAFSYSVEKFRMKCLKRIRCWGCKYWQRLCFKAKSPTCSGFQTRYDGIKESCSQKFLIGQNSLIISLYVL